MERLTILHPHEVVTASKLPRKLLPKGWREPEGESEGESASAGEPVPATDAVPETQPPRLPPGGLDLRDYLSRQEMSLIDQALGEANGVVAQAASLLGMRRTTLVEKMRKYGINRRRPSPEF